eukprot:4485116-Prymnesium_polylepis.1
MRSGSGWNMPRPSAHSAAAVYGGTQTPPINRTPDPTDPCVWTLAPSGSGPAAAQTRGGTPSTPG